MEEFKIHLNVRFEKENHEYFLLNGKKADASVTEVISGAKLNMLALSEQVRDAIQYGSAVHNQVELYFKGEQEITTFKLSKVFIDKIIELAPEDSKEFEKPFIIEWGKYLIGGTADVVADESIIEIKTGNRDIDKHRMQTAIYSHAFDKKKVSILYPAETDEMTDATIDFYLNNFKAKLEAFFKKREKALNGSKKINNDDALALRIKYEYHMKEAERYKEYLTNFIDGLGIEDNVVLNETFKISKVSSSRKVVDMEKAIEQGLVTMKPVVSYRWSKI